MDNYESQEEYTDAMYQQDIQDAQMAAQEAEGQAAAEQANQD